MTTIAQMVTSLQDKGYGIDTEASQKRELERSYQRLTRMRRWNWLQKTSDVIQPVGQATITFATIGSDYRAMEGLRIEGYTPPQYKEYPEFMRYINGSVSNGLPDIWTLNSAGILLYPTPQQPYTFHVDYTKSLPTFATIGVGEVPVPEPLDEWIVWGAITGITFRERDNTGRDQALKEQQIIMSDYLAQHGLQQRQNTSEVVSTGWPETYTNDHFLF